MPCEDGHLQRRRHLGPDDRRLLQHRQLHGVNESVSYLSSLLHYDLSDHHDVEARLKMAPLASVRCDAARSSASATSLSGSRERCALAASWWFCCTATSRCASRHNRCGGWLTGTTSGHEIREMCGITMLYTRAYHTSLKRALKNALGFSR